MYQGFKGCDLLFLERHTTSHFFQENQYYQEFQRKKNVTLILA